jgi:hypothetical protein
MNTALKAAGVASLQEPSRDVSVSVCASQRIHYVVELALEAVGVTLNQPVFFLHKSCLVFRDHRKSVRSR